MNKISIITAIHNQLEYNRLFLESLEKTTFHPYELIIIDNASHDGSAELFRSHGATILRNDENRCYACSQNQGLAKAHTTYVAFLNNDILLSKHWDRILIERADEYGLDVISACGCETLETATAIKHAMRRWKRINAIKRAGAALGKEYKARDLLMLVRKMYGDWDAFTRTRARDFSRFLYPGVSGFTLVARRDLFDRIGPWNPDVTAADFDILLRCVKAQSLGEPVKQPMIAGEVFVHHFVRTTSRSMRKPYACSHPTLSIEKAYPKSDHTFLVIPSVSLVIATYNKPEFLEKIFVSLTRQTFTDFEIVVSDDGSSPAVANVIGRYKNRFSHPVQHVWQENRGFRKTVIANKAVIRSRGYYLVFIDGDCILHHRFLEDHFRARRVGTVLSGRRVMLDKKLTNSITPEDVVRKKIERPSFWIAHAQRSSIKHGVRLSLVSGIEDRWRSSRDKNYCILGSNFSVFKGDFYRVNGYEETITGRGLEDNNLSNRFKRAGIRIRTVARKAIQYHMFHSFEATPHSKDVIERWGTPREYRAEKGILNSDEKMA